MKSHLIRMLALLLISLVCSGNVYGQASKTILVIRSYGIDEGCGVPMERAVREYLTQMGYTGDREVVFHRFVMDTRSVYVTPEAKAERVRLAIDAINRIAPDLIITFDDFAFTTVVLPHVDTPFKFVFAGVNIAPEDYNRRVRFMESRAHPGHNITGVTEEAGSDTALRLLKQIVPEARNMAFLSSKGGIFWEKTARATLDHIQSHPEKYPFKLVDFKLVDNFEDYRKALLQYNQRNDVDVIYNFGSAELREKPNSATGVREDTVMRWILQNQTKPGTTWAIDWIHRGYLCGAGIDPYRSGKQLAVQVHRILNGADPGNIPIERPKDFSIGINLARAQQLGITVPFRILAASAKVFKEMKYYPEFQFRDE